MVVIRIFPVIYPCFVPKKTKQELLVQAHSQAFLFQLCVQFPGFHPIK